MEKEYGEGGEVQAVRCVRETFAKQVKSLSAKQNFN